MPTTKTTITKTTMSKQNKKLGGCLPPEGSISIWHKDGESGGLKVYVNGELAKTKGKYEHLAIVGEPNGKTT